MRKIFALITIIASASVALGSCTGGEELPSSGQAASGEGVSVSAPPGSFRAGTSVRIEARPDLAVNPEWFAGPIVDISAGKDQQPTKSITLNFPPPAPGEAAHIAYLDEQSGWWIPVETRVDKNSGQLLATVNHLSPWTVIRDRIIDATSTVPGAVQNFASVFEYQTFRILGNRGDQPACDGSQPAWVADVVTNPDANSELFACVEAAGDDLLLKVVNNRGYPVTVEFNESFKSADLSLPSNLADLVQRASNLGGASNRLFLTGKASATVIFAQPNGNGGVIEGYAQRDGGTFLTNMVFDLASIAGADLPIGNGKTLGLSTLECFASVGFAPGTTAEAVGANDAQAVAGSVADLRGCVENIVKGERLSAVPGSKSYSRLEAVGRYLKSVKLFDIEQQVLDAFVNDGTDEAELVDISIRWRGQPAPAGSSDLDRLWRSWQRLNDTCRGESGDDPATQQACAERDEVMKQQFDASSAEFLTAWQNGDANRMRELAHADQMPGRTIPGDLLAFTPAESTFGDCQYDPVGTGEAACYMNIAEGGPGLYFRWGVDYEKGWLVLSYAPDV